MVLTLDDYAFDLPETLIASRPLANRSDSRLLHVPLKGHALGDGSFESLIDLLRPNDLLVFNNTRVMSARLYGKKSSGGRVEILIERLYDDYHAKVMIKSNRSLKLPADIWIEGNQLVVESKCDGFYRLHSQTISFIELMHDFGEMPLPPYMARKADEDDCVRYQTVYSSVEGAVAAPTAGLHFDAKLLENLNEAGVKKAFITLHVGAGTFLPVKDSVESHVMHSEWLEVKQEVWDLIRETKLAGGRVIAVGTTSVRALESAYLESGMDHSYRGETQLFIKPSFQFSVCDGIITNFHLPKSTLMMLVGAFIGHEKLMMSYQYAVEKNYRFYSYGDAMIII